MNLLLTLLLPLALPVQITPPPAPGPAPQAVLYGGHIHADADAGVAATATAIALERGRVLAIGTDAEMLALAAKSTRKLDLHGQHVYPGFTDAHAHLLGIGAQTEELNLVDTESFEDIVALVVARAQELPAGAWLMGRGWDQNDWRLQVFPHHALLSAALPEIPVVLSRIDGHALLANAAAMRLAGISAATPDPPGGRILRDQEGNPTGVFIDAAQSLIGQAIPALDRATLQRRALAGVTELHRRGITAIHDAGEGPDAIAVLRELASKELLQQRVHLMLDGSNEALLQEWFARGPAKDLGGHGTLAIRAVKLYADGALGSRGAELLADYSDEPGNRGLGVTPSARMEEVARRALAAGFQVCTHAIGDGGNHRVLDVYQKVGAKEPERLRAARWRIEHAQVIAPEDIARFAALGIIPAMQTQHQTSDMPWAEQRLGPERIHGAYAWRSLIDAGCLIANGSDAPVERLDPIGAFIAAVSRSTRKGQPEGGWYPQQSMTPQEALQSMTTWAARAAFREADLGKLLPGYRADLVILSAPLQGKDSASLNHVQVLATWFAGVEVYRQP